MKRYQAVGLCLIGALFGACTSTTSTGGREELQPQAVAGRTHSIQAVVTTYWRRGTGVDHDTRAGRTSTGLPLVQGETCAADPDIVPYGSKVRIPGFDETMDCRDTGSAVTARVAAKKRGLNLPVVDVFFETEKEAREWADTHPAVVTVQVVSASNKKL